MRCFSIIIFIFFVAVTFSQSQDAGYERVLKQWQGFQQANDNEKDFRALSFLASLEQALKSGISGPDSIGFLPHWQSDTTANNRYSVHASYILFDGRPDRLFYVLHDHEANEVFSFSREMQESYRNNDVIPFFKTTDISGTSLVSIEFRSGKVMVLNIPDIETALGIEKLVRSRDDQTAFDQSALLEERFELLLEEPTLFEEDFSGFPGISTLISPDKEMKIVTWNVEDMAGDHYFFGLVAFRQDEAVKVFRLKDKRTQIESPEFARLNPSQWYGAVYYEIIPVKYRGDMYYTLLGYNGNSAFSRIRLVDVITKPNKGMLQLGSSIFDIQGRMKRRLIYEHSNRANMMLRFDERNDLIVMDHLAPVGPGYAGDRSYYGPDFSHDALEFKNGKWVLLEDIDLRNR